MLKRKNFTEETYALTVTESARSVKQDASIHTQELEEIRRLLQEWRYRGQIARLNPQKWLSQKALLLSEILKFNIIAYIYFPLLEQHN